MFECPHRYHKLQVLLFECVNLGHVDLLPDVLYGRVAEVQGESVELLVLFDIVFDHAFQPIELLHDCGPLALLLSAVEFRVVASQTEVIGQGLEL
jgi:uncharacterized protein (UPF0262 family)